MMLSMGDASIEVRGLVLQPFQLNRNQQKQIPCEELHSHNVKMKDPVIRELW